MKKAVSISILAFLLLGCNNPWREKREKLYKIELGMTKDQVRRIMGKPYRKISADNIEWWLYETEHYRWHKVVVSISPLLFEDGKLIGWAKNYWTAKEQGNDTNQTIREKN